MTKIDDRAMLGKELPPMDKKTYCQRLENSSEATLLFSKRTRSLTNAPRKNASINRLKAELFSLTLTLSMDVCDLKIRAGQGEPRRLVMLKSNVAPADTLPDIVSQSIGVGVEEILAHPLPEELDEEQSEVDVEADADLQEAEAVLEEEMQFQGSGRLHANHLRSCEELLSQAGISTPS